MGTQMLQRRGTDAEWATANPILGDGEIGYDRDTDEIRIGDGVTRWADLPPSQIYIPLATQDLRYLNRNIINAAGDLLVGDADNSVTRLAKGTPGQRLTIQNDGTLAWVDLPPAVNPFTAIDAAGDLLVGTAPDTVGRLAKGTNGQVLSVDSNGNLVWTTTSAVDNTKVAKAGDTMSGGLTINLPAAGNAAALAIGVPGTKFNIRPRGGGGIEFVNNAYSAVVGSMTDAGVFSAAQIQDNGQRVYSPNNPPPVSGMSLLGGIIFQNATKVNSGGYSQSYTGDNIYTDNAPLFTFVAPPSGRVKVISVMVYNTSSEFNGFSWFMNGESLPPQTYPTAPWYGPRKAYAQSGTNTPGPMTNTHYLAGLTPGATYTIYLAWQSGTGTTAAGFTFTKLNGSLFVEG